MPSMTDKITLDCENAVACEHCGAKLPMRMLKGVFGSNSIPMGHVECTCEGAEAQRQREAEEAEAERQRERERQHEQKMAKAGIPKRYRTAVHPYAEKMADMAANGQGFYIHGPNGTYKTTLAMAAGIKLLRGGRNVFAITTYDLMDAMRSRRDEDRTLFSRACACEVLILDDLGKEASNTPYACERLFAIIDKRDKDMKPVIVTSNYRLSEIAKNITEGDVGTAIASRLASSCKQVALEGEDRRLTNGQN